MKFIGRQHGTPRLPFQPEREQERLMEVISPSIHKKHDLRLQCIQTPIYSRSSPQTIALPDGREMVHFDSSKQQSVVEFNVTNTGAHLIRANHSCSSASHLEKSNSRQTIKRKCIIESVLSFEDLQQHFGSRRDDAAKALGVSVSTVKRICRQHGILRWPSRKKKNNYIPLEPLGEKHVSPTCKTPTDGQADIGNEMVGHLSEQNSLSNAENGSKEESIKPLTFQDSFLANYPAMDFSISSTYRESGEAGGTSELTTSNAYPNPNALVFTQPQISLRDTPTKNVGSSKDSRNFFTPAVEAFMGGHGSEPSWTVPLCSDPAPAQPRISISHVMPHPTVRQNIRIVTFKAKYKRNTIRFHLPFTSGMIDLMEEVTKRLQLELGSFDVKYRDKDNELVLIACDADVWDCVNLLSSSDNQVVRLLVQDKVSNSKKSRQSCNGIGQQMLKDKIS